MPSPWKRNVELLFTELENLFISEFCLNNPFRYDDIEPDEQYGLLSFEQWEVDRIYQATDTFKLIRGNFIICTGYATEQRAKIGPLQLMMDLDNFQGIVQEKLISAYDCFYQFQIDPLQPVIRSLRQPIRREDVWISDVTGSAVARLAIDHFPGGRQKYP